MADDENEKQSTNGKPDVKDETSESEEMPAKTEESKPEENSESDEDTGQEEEKSVKTEEKSPKKDDKSPKKENKSVKKEDKSPQKEERPSKKATQDDEEEEPEELPPGLLEQPLEVEGKREKKKVERLSASMIRTPQEKKKVEIEEGSGTKLGDIPYVEHQLNTTKAIDLKPLHRVLFLRIGANNEVKKNIKQFCGFSHGKDSKEYEKRLGVLNKMVLAELKNLCLTLGLERSGTKVNLVERLMDFLMKPEDKGLDVKSKSRKRSKSAGSAKKESKKKKSKAKGTAKKKKVNKEEAEDEEGESNEDDEEEEEEEEEEEPEEDSEDEAPKKKKAKVEKKKTPPKKAAKENGKKEKPAPKKEAKKPSPKKKSAVAELSDSLSDDSEDEPIANIKKASPPSNDEIKDLVKKILEGADLETVTMKTVVKQVYSKYPSFDLSDRKDFIKDTVRQVIS